MIIKDGKLVSKVEDAAPNTKKALEKLRDLRATISTAGLGTNPALMKHIRAIEKELKDLGKFA